MNHNALNYIKCIFTGVWAAVASFCQIMAIPAVLLVICNIIDYITAFMVCKYSKKKFQSDIAMKGIIKKVTQWCLVVVGVIVDEILLYASDQVGYNMPFKFVIGCLVAIWLISCELLSITENIASCGVPLPPFLQPIIKTVKKETEAKGNAEAGKLETKESKKIK